MAVSDPPELQTDIRGARAIAILGKLTVFVLANAQSPNLSTHSCLHLRPRAAWVEAPATRLRRVVFRRERHHEALRHLFHQPDTDARRIAPVADDVRPAGDRAPRAVRQHKRATVFRSVHAAQATVERRLGLLRLDVRPPSSMPVTEVRVVVKRRFESSLPLLNVRLELCEIRRARVEVRQVLLVADDTLGPVLARPGHEHARAQLSRALTLRVAHARSASIIVIDSHDKLVLAWVHADHV